MARLFSLGFRGPLYLEGGVRGGMFPRSDTLSAALVSVWGAANPGSDVASIARRPPFRVSSALPTVPRPGGGVEVLLPVPAGAWTRAARGDPGRLKNAKKVLFADSVLVRAALSGKPLPDWFAWDKGLLATSFKGSGDYAAVRSRLRLAVDRETGAPVEGALFTSSGWSIAAGCGLSVVAEVEDADVPSLRAAFRLLGMDGMGADRFVGMGSFELLADEPWSPPSLGTGGHLLLSLCRPTQEDVAHGVLDGAYGLVDRGGWITSGTTRSLRRGRVRMLVEGSYVPASAGPAPGEVVEVQPPRPELGLSHSVYRDGRAVTIPVAAGGSDA